MNNCLFCKKETANKKFCSIQCQMDLMYTTNINRWKLGEISGSRGDYNIADWIRRYLFNKYNNKCCKCGWSEINPSTRNIPLEINHIDGNHKNNKERISECHIGSISR